MSPHNLCERCGAPIPPEAFAQEHPVCGYCHAIVEPARRPARAPDRRLGGGARGGGAALAAMVGVGVVVVAGVLGWRVLARPTPMPAAVAIASAAPGSSPAPSAEAPAPAQPADPVGPPGVMWIDQYAHVVPADVNGDGVDDLLGAFAKKEGANVNAYVGAFDGKDMRLLWSDGPFSTREKGTRKTKVAFAGGRVVATTARGEATLYEALDGKRLATFPFSDEIGDPCGPPGKEKIVWIAVRSMKEKGFAIDVASAVGKPAPPPPWCVERRHRLRDSSDVWTRQARTLAGGFLINDAPDSALPKVPRFDLKVALEDGDDAVAAGELRGEDGAVFVGFDPKTKTVRWQTGVKALTTDGVTKVDRTNVFLDIAFGRFYFDYERDAERHLAALDVKTGTKVFDARLANAADPTNPTFTPSTIYVVLWRGDNTPVSVLDASSGVLLATLGGLAPR